MTDTPNKELLLQDAGLAAWRQFRDALVQYRKETKKPSLFHFDGEAKTIPVELLRECRVFPQREALIADFPKDGVWAEVGTLQGRFARRILDLASPKKLVLIDMDYARFERQNFLKEISDGTLELKQGMSWEVLSSFSNNFFDFIYIDAGHDYASVRKDLNIALQKVRSGGYIICNDFVNWSVMEAIPYGVYKAVIDFVIEN